MQISNRLAGFSLSQADMLRRAMGKKDAAEMAKQKIKFMEGAAENKHPQSSRGQHLRPHGEVRGVRLQQVPLRPPTLFSPITTAYLKTHYPVEFMAALLTSETSKPENVVKYISECREINIPVVPPNVNVSDANFTPIKTDKGYAIGFGLAAIKNVGHNAIESIIVARNTMRETGKQGFSSLWEFCEKVDLRLLNKRVLESLIKAGAMDVFGGRAQVAAALDKAMERAQKIPTRRGLRPARPLRHLRLRHHPHLLRKQRRVPPQRRRVGRAHPPAKRKRGPWLLRLRPPHGQVPREASQHEGHRHRHRSRDEARAPKPSVADATRSHKTRFRSPASSPASRSPNPNAPARCTPQAILEDTVGKIDLIAFPAVLREARRKTKDRRPRRRSRRPARRRGTPPPKLAISGIQALEDIKLKLPESLRIKIPLHNPDVALLEKLHAVFLGAPGKGKVLLDLEEPGEFCAVLEPHNLLVAADRLFIDNIEELVGRGGVRVMD